LSFCPALKAAQFYLKNKNEYCVKLKLKYLEKIMNNKTKPIPATAILMACDSSQIDSYAYMEKEQLFLVMFKFGGLYAYRGVPAETFQAAVNAESIGKFLEAEIKPVYEFVKVHGGKMLQSLGGIN
jgi:hypothetical protein